MASSAGEHRSFRGFEARWNEITLDLRQEKLQLYGETLRMPRNRTRAMHTAKFEELLHVHVRYELDMLFGTFHQLASPVANAVVGNALIESFCLHARQLLDFFGNAQGLHATEFTDSGYTPLANDVLGIGSATTKKLNTQIAHLTKERVSDGSEKIGPEDRARLRAAVETALRHFEGHLRSPFRGRWGTYSVPSVTTAGQLTATNAVMTLSTGARTISTSSLEMIYTTPSAAPICITAPKPARSTSYPVTRSFPRLRDGDSQRRIRSSTPRWRTNRTPSRLTRQTANLSQTT